MINEGYLDEVIFVPTGNHYKIKNNLVRDIDRYNMIKLVTDKNPKLSVSDFELKDQIVFKTYKSIEHLQFERIITYEDQVGNY